MNFCLAVRQGRLVAQCASWVHFLTLAFVLLSNAVGVRGKKIYIKREREREKYIRRPLVGHQAVELVSFYFMTS